MTEPQITQPSEPRASYITEAALKS